MAVQKSSQRRKRQFISHRDVNSRTLFLVYVYDTNDNVLVSDGPYYNFSDAYKTMRGNLSDGLCSWVVTYNE
jgi:hypothetical protein